MKQFWKKKRDPKIQNLDQSVEQLNGSLEEEKVKPSLDENMAMVKKLFADMDMIRYKVIETEGKHPARYGIVFCDGMVSSEIINTNIVKPLMLLTPAGKGSLVDCLLTSVVQVGESQVTDQFKSIVENVTYGDTILFADGCPQAAILNTKNFALRSITEPENEKVLGGPREGFTESLTQNISQIMRRLRTHELKIKKLTLGRITQTSVCICYIESVVNKEVLNELYRRINKIDIDGVLEENYIAENIRDHPFSTFRTTGYTERPDVVAAKLLEGRIAMVVDGSPMATTIPYLFIENFQSNEDYYYNFYYASFSRMLRISAFLLTVAVPGFFIAVVAFHQEMLPLQLLMKIALERQSVPLPAALEAVVMLLVFDLLRETGVRMPSNIGQALSIVGALVIGQAAVEANLVAAPMIIMVAATGITGLLVPKLNAPIAAWRIIVLAFASAFGSFGLSIGLGLMLVHICSLTSFGVEQVSLKGSLKFQANKDIFFRAPWPKMIERPDRLSRNKVRQTEGNNHG